MRGAGSKGVEPSPSETTGVSTVTGSRSRYRSIREAMLLSNASGPAELGHTAIRDDRDEERRRVQAAHLGDVGERSLDGALRRLMDDDVQDRTVGCRHLHEAGDRDVVRGEPLRRVREHARAVVDLEMDVEGRPQGTRRQGVELAPARVVLEKAVR